MNPPIAYLLKMVLVSGVLYAYYHAVLRDKRFHQWNRFYLLAAALLSVTLPLFHIPVRAEETQDNRLLLEVWRVLGKGSESTVTVTATQGLTWLALVGYIYGAVVAAQLLVLGAHLVKLRRMRRGSPHMRLDDVTLVTTTDRGTPFSFFRWIFWNDTLALDSEEGQRVLRHELTHVRQRHSLDKVLMQVLCAVLFPVLPLYWMRRELQLVHEYLADKQATEDADAYEYARLLLSQAFHASPNVLANSFFQHPLKRRLAMMTRFSNPKYTYLRKVMFLPVALLLFALLAFRVEAKHPMIMVRLRAAESTVSGALLTKITAPDTARPEVVVIGRPVSKKLEEVTVIGHAAPVKRENVTLQDLGITSRPESVTVTDQPRKLESVTVVGYAAPRKGEEVTVMGYARPLAKSYLDTVPDANVAFARISQPSDLDSVLMFVDGKMCPPSILQSLNPNTIESITVLKDQTAINKYGLLARNGVIEITTKSAAQTIAPQTDNDNLVFTKVEVEAAFPGGDAAWNEYVRHAITAHMDELQAEKKSGTCEIQFIVNRQGVVSDVQALTMQGTALANLCVNAIKRGPLWVPARNNGHVVKAFRKQKITFQMPE